MVKKKILMVHGWMHSAKRYIQLKEELEKSGIGEVTLYEFPGFGESKPKYYFNVLRCYKKDVENELMENDYDYVIGHSMGGNILLRVMTERAYKTKLILLSPEYRGIDYLKPLIILYPLLYIPLLLVQKLKCSVTTFLIKCMAFLTINDWKKIDNIIVEDVRKASTLVALNTMIELAWDCWRVDRTKWKNRKVNLIIGEKDRIILRYKMNKLKKEFDEINIWCMQAIGHTAVLENYSELLEILQKILKGED